MSENHDGRVSRIGWNAAIDRACEEIEMRNGPKDVHQWISELRVSVPGEEPTASVSDEHDWVATCGEAGGVGYDCSMCGATKAEVLGKLAGPAPAPCTGPHALRSSEAAQRGEEPPTFARRRPCLTASATGPVRPLTTRPFLAR